MRTRAKILDCATRTFLRRGLSRASLSDIASLAGVTRGAVYGHFKNKSALFDAMFEYAALPADPFLVELHENHHRDPLDYLRSELVRLLGEALSNGAARRLYSIIYSRCEITRETRSIWNRMHAARRLAEQRIATVLNEAHWNGQLRDRVDVGNMAVMIHSCLMGFFFRSLGEPVPRAANQAAERVVALVLFDLCRPGASP